MKKNYKMKKEKIELRYYGKYRLGLTEKEIKEYLKERAGTTKLGNLYKKFGKIAGANTMAVIFTDCCKKKVVLMYRWDVQNFADNLFLGTPFIWD